MDISLRSRVILGEVEHEEYIVTVGIQSRILVGLEDSIPIELMEVVFAHHCIDLIQGRIDTVEPDA
jgi:hypothetical protein